MQVVHLGSRVGMAALVMLACLFASSASAQALYRCKSGVRTYVSDRPCGPGADTKITVYGPERTTDSRPSYSPPLRKAPDHLQYLSPQCAELNDAIRTAPSRGVGRETQADLREEYQAKCQEDEADARRRLGQERRKERDDRKAEISSREADVARSASERERCAELLRILRQKRQRLDNMTDGERADHQRFEANYTERCK